MPPNAPDRAAAKEHFAGNALAITAVDIVAGVIESCGSSHLTVSKTQVGWSRRRGFVTLWDPRRWLGERGAPVVVSVALTEQDHSSVWKEVVEVRPGLWQHHREIHSPADLDVSLTAAVRRAYLAAG